MARRMVAFDFLALLALHLNMKRSIWKLRIQKTTNRYSLERVGAHEQALGKREHSCLPLGYSIILAARGLDACRNDAFESDVDGLYGLLAR